jgi:hypothetical protein
MSAAYPAVVILMVSPVVSLNIFLVVFFRSLLWYIPLTADRYLLNHACLHTNYIGSFRLAELAEFEGRYIWVQRFWPIFRRPHYFN